MGYRRWGQWVVVGCAVLGMNLAAWATQESPDVAAVYQQHCASCHGIERLGGIGPALLPDNLGRLRPQEAEQVISVGRPATQMPAFASALKEADIKALAQWIYQPPKQIPLWDEALIRASQIVNHRFGELPDDPVFNADLMNLFIVVELGDHHVTLLDGDRFEPIHRFASRFALHGGPKYSPDGRYVYFASRDGWISKFDIYRLKTVAEIRVGINARNLAISHDGRWVMVANYLPHNLVLLDARNLDLVKIINTDDGAGKGSRVSAVYTAPPRHSFIAALKDVKEVWEIPYPDEQAAPATKVGTDAFPVRRLATDDYLDDFFFDPSYRHLIGASRDGGKGQVIDLDSGNVIATLAIPGMPHLGSGISWTSNGKTLFATPNLKTGKITLVDMQDWKVIKELDTLGPGFFMRSHQNSRYAWVDVFFGKDRDAMHLIDKTSLEIAHTIRPSPGKTAAHVEFTRDGKYALVSIWEMDGALVVYDAETLREVKRLPMVKPSGKYNVYNKTRYEPGTSH